MAAAVDPSSLPSVPTMGVTTYATLPQLPGTDFSRCALDAFRTACAVHLSRYLGIELEAAYAGVDISKQKETDFTVAVPRFRLKEKPQDVAKKVIDSVRAIYHTVSSGCF